MPWFVLATAFAAIYARLLRANLLEVMGEDYIRTARAKGLGERRVIFHHGMRSALTPIVTILGLDIGILVGGAILTESVFNIPGIGRLTFDAIQRGDVITVQGATLFLALAVCLCNLLVDVLYSVLDPRVRTVMTEPLLSVRDLHVHFATDDGLVKAVDGVSYDIGPGRTLGIVGESGSGKSVSSLTVMGLTRSKISRITGEIHFGGTDLLQALGRRDAPHPRRGDRDDLPGPAVVAASLLPHRRPARGGGPGPPQGLQGGGARQGGGAAAAGRHPAAARTASAATRTSSPAACASA